MRFKKAKRLFDEYNTNWVDHHVYSHGLRLRESVLKICEGLNIDKYQTIDIELAAKYHDIGKIKFPPKLHLSYRKFTKKDIKIFKNHAKYGHDILKSFYGDESIANLVLYHHEKIDGSGYPKGLKDDKIPLGSRIITVCDAYDAMFRHYRQRTKEEAIQELKKFKGKHFDEKIVDIFLKIIGSENENH